MADHPKRRFDPDWPFRLPQEWGEAGRQLFFLKFQRWLDDVAAGRERWSDDQSTAAPKNRKPPAGKSD